MSTQEPNAFGLLCQLVTDPVKEWFKFTEGREPVFHYHRQRQDGLRATMLMPLAEVPYSIVRNLLSQATFELEITAESRFMSFRALQIDDGHDLPDTDEKMAGILLLGHPRFADTPAHPTLPKNIVHLLLETRGADPASRAWYQVSRGGVIMCLCDPNGGDRFLYPPASFAHSTIEDGLRIAENIQFLHALAASGPALELKRLYTDRTYDRQDENSPEAK